MSDNVKLSDLPNIGKTVEAQLVSVGIDTPQKLADTGSRTAWLLIQETDPSACVHRLQALEGAIMGIKKSQLPPEVKADLKAFYDEHKLA